MQKNTLEDYKAGIKAKYEEEKLGDYSSFLLNPSRAKLRNLCITILSGDTNSDDLKSFQYFFGFEFKEENRKELKNNTDKFRPLETFFKNETDLTDLTGLDLAAILVNYNPRPLRRFLKQTNITTAGKEQSSAYSIGDSIVDFTQKKEQSYINEALLLQENTTKPKVTQAQILRITNLANQIFNMLKVLIIVSILGYGVKEFFFQKKDCMQWQNDHYEVVDCVNKIQSVAPMIEAKPIIEEELKLKKIEVNMHTTFFHNDKAVIWYSKNKDKIEYFNNGGFHPVNGKPLQPITVYMINKYIKK
ncbi:MAG: hypothetical protein V4548_12175 [Bacteroidota bacterium]